MTATLPQEYTHPDVLGPGITAGWAEPETDPTRINWPERQARAAIPFTVAGGRPVNPVEDTAVPRGRNEMGWWGENLMADAPATVTWQGVRYVLLVERADGYGWAIPGGHVEAGEAALDAALRELEEETGLSVQLSLCRQMPARYVRDPRNSREAWAVTIPVHVQLPDRHPAAGLPEVAGADDARRAEWVPADTYGLLVLALADLYGGKVFAAHEDMLRELLDGQDPDEPEPPTRPVVAIGSEPADVKEAIRHLERLDALPAAQHGAILTHGLAAIAHAVLALRETVADSGDGLADILDSGLVNISDEVSMAAGAVADVEVAIDGGSWRALLRQLRYRATAAMRRGCAASPIGGSSSW
jgi:ADP-ribose pyrophosphatase YjhB (NUDIX family)